MDRAERALYHQIHPAKIATDLTAEVVSTVLLWRHRLVPGLVVRLVPPAVASAILTERTSDLVRIRDSAAGGYLRDHLRRDLGVATFRASPPTSSLGTSCPATSR